MTGIIGQHLNRAGLTRTYCLDRRNDRVTIIIDALLIAACIFVITNRLADH